MFGKNFKIQSSLFCSIVCTLSLSRDLRHNSDSTKSQQRDDPRDDRRLFLSNAATTTLRDRYLRATETHKNKKKTLCCSGAIVDCFPSCPHITPTIAARLMLFVREQVDVAPQLPGPRRVGIPYSWHFTRGDRRRARDSNAPLDQFSLFVSVCVFVSVCSTRVFEMFDRLVGFLFEVFRLWGP